MTESYQADLRRQWRLYLAARETLFPYAEPLTRPSWSGRLWIRWFG